jgi:predicted nuclease with RNAse H fold
MDTTRRYPRTLREAFPHENRHSVEHYKRPLNKNKVVWILCGSAIICFCIGKLL